MKVVSNKWIHSELIVFCLFSIIGISVYMNSLHNSFHLDDLLVVGQNSNIRSLKNTLEFFKNPRTLAGANDPSQAGHYRPLVVLSYAINYAIGGLNTAGYHIVNLAFHVGTAFLLFLIVKAMLESRLEGRRLKAEVRSKKQEARQEVSNGDAGFFAALAAGLIFLVHPFNSEAVNYITARFSLMSGFFYLLGFYFWVRYRELAGSSKQLADKTAYRSLLPVHYYSASFLAFLAGMLSKEVVITLPVVCFLYDLYFYHPRQSASSIKQLAVSSKQLADKSAYSSPLTANYLLNWRTYIPYLPFILIVVIPYLAIRAFSFGGVFPHFQRDIWTQMFTETRVLVKHLQLFIIPAPLTIVHDVEIYRNLWEFPVIYSTMILLVFAGIAVLLSRVSLCKWRVASFFIIWFFIVLLPTTIFPLNAIFQENRGYLAIVSFAVFAGIVIGEVRERWYTKGALTLLILLISIYSAGVVQRNRIWKDDLTLWTDTVHKVPRSSVAYAALAITYRRLEMYDKSLEASQRAMSLGGGGIFSIHENLGKIYMVQKKWDLAAMEMETAIKLYPYWAEDHYDLGEIYYRTGKMDLSEKEFQTSIRLVPGSYRPYFYLGMLYLKMGKLEDAANAYQKGLYFSPARNLKGHLSLGILLENVGRKEEAALHYRKVIEQAIEGERTLAQEASERLEKMEEHYGKERK